MSQKIMNDVDLANHLMPKRLLPPIPDKFKDVEVHYVYDDEDEVTLTFKEVVEIIAAARNAGPRMIPVMGSVNSHEISEIK